MLETLECKTEQAEAIRELDEKLAAAVASCEAGKKFTAKELKDYFQTIYKPAFQAA